MSVKSIVLKLEKYVLPKLILCISESAVAIIVMAAAVVFVLVMVFLSV